MDSSVKPQSLRAKEIQKHEQPLSDRFSSILERRLLADCSRSGFRSEGPQAEVHPDEKQTFPQPCSSTFVSVKVRPSNEVMQTQCPQNISPAV